MEKEEQSMEKEEQPRKKEQPAKKKEQPMDKKEQPMEYSPLVIRKRSEGSKLISIRLDRDTLMMLDKLSKETNYSRNELINLILTHGVNTVEIA